MKRSDIFHAAMLSRPCPGCGEPLGENFVSWLQMLSANQANVVQDFYMIMAAHPSCAAALIAQSADPQTPA